MSTAEPSVSDLNPVLKAGSYEPAFGLDTTGSMSLPAVEGGSVSRWDVLREAFGSVVEALYSLDSEAAEESAKAGSPQGGVMVTTFAGGKAQVRGDWRTDNWQQEWKKIQLGGHTEIMPVYDEMRSNYMDEFGERDIMDRPHLLGVIFTDGEADDTKAFEDALAKAKTNTYIVLVILGYGTEHDRALAEYNTVAAANNHVRVVSFANVADADVITNGVLSLMGVA